MNLGRYLSRDLRPGSLTAARARASAANSGRGAGRGGARAPRNNAVAESADDLARPTEGVFVLESLWALGGGIRMRTI